MKYLYFSLLLLLRPGLMPCLAQIRYGDAASWKGVGAFQGALRQGDSTVLIFMRNFDHRLSYAIFDGVRPVHTSTEKETNALERLLGPMNKPLYCVHDSQLTVFDQGEFMADSHDAVNGTIALYATDFKDFPKPVLGKRTEIAQLPVASKLDKDIFILRNDSITIRDSVYASVAGAGSFTLQGEACHAHIALFDAQYRVVKQVVLPLEGFSHKRSQVSCWLGGESLYMLHTCDSIDRVALCNINTYTLSEVSLRTDSVRTLRIASDSSLRLTALKFFPFSDGRILGLGIYQPDDSLEHSGLYTCWLRRAPDRLVVEKEVKTPFSKEDLATIGKEPLPFIISPVTTLISPIVSLPGLAVNIGLTALKMPFAELTIYENKNCPCREQSQQEPFLSTMPFGRMYTFQVINMAPQDSSPEIVCVLETNYFEVDRTVSRGVLFKRILPDASIAWSQQLSKKQVETSIPGYNSLGYFSSFLLWNNGSGCSIVYNDHAGNSLADSADGGRIKAFHANETGSYRAVRAELGRDGTLTRKILIGPYEAGLLETLPSTFPGIVRTDKQTLRLLLLEPWESVVGAGRLVKIRMLEVERGDARK